MKGVTPLSRSSGGWPGERAALSGAPAWTAAARMLGTSSLSWHYLGHAARQDQGHALVGLEVLIGGNPVIDASGGCSRLRSTKSGHCFSITLNNAAVIQAL